MTFLQPWILFALPLLVLPVLIHLLHLRRHQSVPWGAMQFLLAATKMASGYSKLRQWLVLAVRTLAILFLIFFVSRPLASGVAGWLANDLNEMTILILDRSPSMQVRDSNSGLSKLDTAKQRFAELMSAGLNTGLDRSFSVIAAGHATPIEFSSTTDFLSDPRMTGSDLSSDILAMIERARLMIEHAGAPKSTVWIASDMRENDWRTATGAWSSLESSFSKLDGEVRFQLLELREEVSNRSLELIGARQVTIENGKALSLSYRVISNRPAATDPAHVESIPLEIQIGEATTVTNVELQQGKAELIDQRIPLDPTSSDGVSWGAIRIPADSNPVDNSAYFTFGQAPPRKSLIVSDSPEAIEALTLCASIPADADSEMEVLESDAKNIATVDWNGVVFVVWHAPIPTEEEALPLTDFLKRGGQVLFVPPETPSSATPFGLPSYRLRWGEWKELATAGRESDAESESMQSRVEQWRNDTLLLSNTQSGEALPLGEVELFRICEMDFEGSKLASLSGGTPWLVRLDSSDEGMLGTAYALATTTSEIDSNLARNGIALYIMVQRLIAEGASKLGNSTNRIVQSSGISKMESAEQLLGSIVPLSNRYGEHAGVYRDAKTIFAQNRSHEEDRPEMVSEEGLKKGFGELTWYRTDVTSDHRGLVQEIWRWFAIGMLILLLAESALSLPAVRKVPAVK